MPSACSTQIKPEGKATLTNVDEGKLAGVSFCDPHRCSSAEKYYENAYV